MKKILFITGTDTGVGKTVLTALLLHHLRQNGEEALALKLFCSGGRSDAQLLHGLQKEDITLDEVNPFYFPKPVAPWVATGGKEGQGSAKKAPSLTLKGILRPIRAQQRRCETLLIEGSGGIMVPLTKSLLVADLMEKLACEAILVARNSLGTINHTLLTVRELQKRGVKIRNIVLMDVKVPDLSSRTNEKTLKHFLPAISVFSLIYLGEEASKLSGIKENAKKMKISVELKRMCDNLFTSQGTPRAVG